jgi:chromosomal replication initiator protein
VYQPLRSDDAPGGGVTLHDRDIIEALSAALERRIGKPRYQLWFDRRTRLVFEEDRLTVGVANRHLQEWLQERFGTDVAAAAEAILGHAVEVRFAIDPQLFQAARREQAEVQPPSPPAPPTLPDPPTPKREAPSGRSKKKPAAAEQPTLFPQEAQPAPAPQRRARRWHRLSDFIVGPCNRVAHASALSVVEGPGEGPNPLVLYGPVGTGKTHLLEGICSGLRRTRPDWRVVCVSSEEFTNRFLQQMHTNRLSGFRRHFRECDVLLLDDLHFLAGKRATQEEFLHTFDALLGDGRQVVVSCDCHPRLADDFSPELADRLLGGAVWGLSPPDADTRLEILRKKCSGGSALPEEVLRFIASQLRGNVRELEGAIHSVRHFSRVTGRAVDIPLVREALADLLRHAVRVVRLADVDGAVCAALRLDTGSLQSKARAWAISHPRMVAMFLARKHTASSYSDIGGHFGGRNHSTVVAAEKKVRQWLQTDAELALGERRIRVAELIERVERDLLR